MRLCSFALTLAFSVPAVVAATQITIDHVTIAGSDLEVLRHSFTTATGIPTEYGGRHANHATEMALVSFSDGGYLEFMAIQHDSDPKAVADHVWSRFLRGNAGPCAFAIRGPSPQGVEVKAAVRSGRTRPDGVRLEWESSDIGAGVRGTFFPFLIHDLTPRENRVYLSGKPTTMNFSGIQTIVIAVSDLDGAIRQYRRAFGLSAPLRQRDSHAKANLAWFEGTPIVLAQGVSDDSWVSLRVSKYGNGPCAVVLASSHGLTGSDISTWFGKQIYWINAVQLGWHLGIETTK